MSRRADPFGFGTDDTGQRYPSEVAQSRGRRHGSGLGLRPSRYVGKHRGFEEADDFKPSRAERRAERKRVRKGHDFGFGA